MFGRGNSSSSSSNNSSSFISSIGHGAGERMLPVFVFPNSLTFVADNQSHHKQVVTVYNPYDFGVRFKVLCTAPEKYIMADSEGTIRPHCCMDLVIRHNAVSQANIGVTDNFRISIHEHGQRQLFGKKDIPAILLKSAPDERSSANSSSEQENFRQLLPSRATDRGQQYSIAASRQVRDNTHTNMVVVLLGFICGVVLMLPVYDEDERSNWIYFQPTVNLKLIASFFLGMAVTLFIKS